MSKTQVFRAFALIMRALIWIMGYLSGVRGQSWIAIKQEYESFIQEEF